MRSITVITSFILALSTTFLIGCGAKLPSIKPYKMEIQQGNIVTSKMLLQLRPGMTKSQVRYILGTPLIVDSFHDDRWDYFYQLRQDGKVVEKRRVIVDFDKDALVSVRGDVVAAGDKTAEAPTNTAPKSVEPPKKEESKSWLDRLKFWKSDEEKPASNPSEDTDKKAMVNEAVLAPEHKTDSASKSSGVDGTGIVLAAPVAPPETEPTLKAEPESVLKKEIELPREKAESPVADATGAEVTAVPNEPIVAKAIPVQPEAETPKSEVSDSSVAPSMTTVPETQGDSEASKQAVLIALNAWADAWRGKDFNRYVSSYAKSFKPDGMATRSAWEAQRKVRVSKRKGDISLVLEDVTVQVDGNKATVQFFQKYSSKVYSDDVTKQLNFQLEPDTHRWLIVKESVLPEGTRPAVQKVLAPEGTEDNLEGIIEKIGF